MSVTRMCAIAVLALSVAPALCVSAQAQSTPTSTLVSRDPAGNITLRAVRVAEPIRLDGKLDEPPYTTVTPFTDFIQQEPREGEPTTEKTETWIFFDDTNVYVAARLWDSHPERMVMNELRHDSNNLINNEQLTIIFDTFHDRRNGFLFLVNALGGMLEESFVDERNNSRDWNTVWNARTARFDQGWTLEVAIPFKSLRYKDGREQVWGINMNRIIRWKNERTYLSPIPSSVSTGAVFKVSSAATLIGLEAPPAAKHLELKPYAIGKITTDRNAKPVVSNEATGDGGFDLKYGVTRALTADLTFRTDFAQVEEDVAQVNLTRFNLFFPEKREFFLEGQGIFNFGGQTSTGAAGSATDTPILFFSRQIGINQGKPVPIIGGGRLTGKTGPYSVGFVNIQTDDEPATAARATNFTVARLRRDIFSRSTLGVLFTRRSNSATSADDSNEAFGVDGTFAFFQNLRMSAYLAKTRTPGRKGNDFSYRGAFDYTGDTYGLQVEQTSVGEDFNPEVGFLRRTNFDKSFANVRFSPRPTSLKSVRKFYYESNYSFLTTGNTGRLESRDAGLTYRIEFQNSDRINVDYTRLYERLQTPFKIATDVTIPVGAYGFQQLAVSYQLGQQRRLSGTVTALRGSFYSGNQTGVSYAGRVGITTQFALEPTVSVNWIDLLEGRFTTRLVSTRATFTVTPRMFIAALPQYNSSTNTFSNNLRFRWEYQPGSELFVVYTEGRNTTQPGFPTLDNRGFVVKINRLVRL